MNDKIKTFFNKQYVSKIRYYVLNVIVTGLFMYCIKGLTDYDNMEYQTWKNQAGAKAVFAFMAIIFILRKVRLINWQSLIATVLFVPFVIERMTFWKGSPDILNVLKPQMAAEWLALMIIIDMMLYKDVNNLFKGVNYLLILYALLTVGMLYRRNGKMDPILLVFPFFLFALVKMDEEKSDWLLRRFLDGWFGIFVYVTVRSFLEYPVITKRYYGYFLNLGAFGVFMTCALTAAVFALIYSKKKYGRKSFFYVMSLIWIVASAIMIVLIDTRDSFAGLAFLVSVLYVFNGKDITSKALKKRGLKLAAIYVAAIAVFALLITIIVSNRDFGKALENSFIARKIPALEHLFHKLYNAASYSVKGDTLGEKIILVLDNFSSGRITLYRAFKPLFNYEGNGSVGIEITTGYFSRRPYWAYYTHNNYIQYIVEYGYFTFIEITSLCILSLVMSVKRFLRGNKDNLMLISFMWLAMMLGTWIGEVNSFYYPVTFFGFVFIARLLVPEDDKETKKSEALQVD